MTISKAARILLIEDDEALAIEEGKALEKAGYKVTRARDMVDGLKKLHEARPDLIIMSKELPIMEGNHGEIYLIIREQSYVPIIVTGGEETKVEILELGADAYVTKPPSLDVLVARVRSLLRRKMRKRPPPRGGGPGVDIEKERREGDRELKGQSGFLPACRLRQSDDSGAVSQVAKVLEACRQARQFDTGSFMARERLCGGEA